MAGSGGNAVNWLTADQTEAIIALGLRLNSTYATDAEVAAADVAATAANTKYARLAADSADVNASVVLVESGLSLTLPIGTHEVSALLSVTSAALADFRAKFVAGTATVTAASSDIYNVAAPAATSSATVMRAPAKHTAWNTETTYLVDAALAEVPFRFKGVLTVTVAGTVTIQFSQGTSDASNTHVDSGSYFTARKVA